MTKLYAVNVNIRIPIVVQAVGRRQVYTEAMAHLNDILNGIDLYQHTEPVVLWEIKTIEMLPDEWDGMCIPYGGDGNTRIAEILKDR